MKNSKGMLIASVAFFLLGFGFLTMGITIYFIRLTASFSVPEEHCTVDLKEVRRVGDTYEQIQGDQILTYVADEGCSIFELTFSVTNDGIEERYQEAPGFYYSGENYGDVSDLWITDIYYDYEEEPLFYYDGEPYLPAGRTTEVKEYVQVREGVKAFEASYYTGNSDQEQSVRIVLP